MSETQEQTYRQDVDLLLEKAGVQAFYSEFLLASRPAPPMLIFWRGQKRICTVTCRQWEDEADKVKAIMQMLWMSPAVMSTTYALTTVEPIKLRDRLARCVILVAVTVRGALSIVTPYEIDDADHTITFDDDAELDPAGGGAYPENIAHMLPIFAQQARAIFDGPTMVQYLSNRGFEIEFAEGEDMSTVSTYSL